MEAQETPVRRRRTSLLWVIPLLVLVAIAADSALLMVRDSQLKAATVAQTGPDLSCEGKCGGGGCGMMGAAKTAKATCPGHEAIAKRSGAPGAAKSGPTAGKCPMMGAMAKHEVKATGKCPAGGDCGKPAGAACPRGGDGSCPMHKSSTATTARPAAAEKATGAVYICTMCPDVKSDKPGKCPKCGMALVKKTP